MLYQQQALITDLYQLTMAVAYWQKNVNHLSTFELFVRKLPANRSFLVAAGIEQCLDYITSLNFSPEEINFLQNHPIFKDVSPEFFNYLKEFKFTGDVWAVEEGAVFFSNEPVIRVTAPAVQSQILETYLLSMFNFQTLIASKAARMVNVSNDRSIVEFGTRRAHSPEAGTLAARAAFIGGCEGTSNVMAGLRYNIPIYGTMAHSWVMSFESEEEAFRSYSEVFPQNNVLLIDTYDTVEAAKIVAQLPFNVTGIRLDSGDIELLSKQVRKILDNSGKNNTKILASGDLNEYSIKELLEKNSPIDIFGVGTELSTSKDAPALGGVYKLVEQEINGKTLYKAKFSTDKVSYPAKKQVYRFIDTNGHFDYDIIALNGEFDNENAIKLLKPAIINGTVCENFNLNVLAAKNHCKDSLSKLPLEYKQLKYSMDYPVKISPKLENLTNQLREQKLLYV